MQIKIYRNPGMAYFTEITGPVTLVNVAEYWKRSSSEGCDKKLSQILANNIYNWGRGLVSEFMQGVV